jgi:hypothetical protein
MTAGRRQELHTDLAARCVELRLPAVYEAHHRLGAGDLAGAVVALDRFTDFMERASRIRRAARSTRRLTRIARREPGRREGSSLASDSSFAEKGRNSSQCAPKYHSEEIRRL